MIEHCEQSKANICKAALAERMHKISICPGNYYIYYNRGWFQVDGKYLEAPFRDRRLQKRAEELLSLYKKTKKPVIGFSKTWNTYVILNC